MPISHINGTAFTSVSHRNGAAKASILAINGLPRQTGEELRVAAEAAATAASATLFYIKSDRSNIFQDTAAATPATTVTDPIGRINAVVGSETLTQASLRPTLIATSGGYGWNCDGTDDTLSLSVAYFADGDDTFVIAAGVPAESSTARVIFHCGTSGTNVRYPYLAVLATDIPNASWRGDDTVLRSCDGPIGVSDLPGVLTAWKSGLTKQLYLNGVQAGSTESNAVGSIASITRSRINSNSSNGNCFLGPIGLICISKTMTSAQRVAIERFAAYIVGATYTVGL
jgi:hypothetical protein